MFSGAAFGTALGTLRNQLRILGMLQSVVMVLCLAILPLTVFAAISMAARISQHGLSPERLWGLVAVAVACSFGLAYLVAVIRGRQAGWRERVRQANLHLAAAVCGVAFILALPIFDFGAISARNQVARLEAAEVTPDKFDYSALRWDFGDAGREALEGLAKNRNAKVAELAQAALSQQQRNYRAEAVNKTRAEFQLRVQPDDPAVRKLVLDYLVANPYQCEQGCVAVNIGSGKGGKRAIALVNQSGYTRVSLPDQAPEAGPAKHRTPPKFSSASKVEVRTVEQRYIFIDGRPIDPPLDVLEGAPAPR
jgi:hypothetical protein